MKKNALGEDNTLVRVPVHVRHTERAEEAPARVASVLCPVSKTQKPLGHCLDCERRVELTSDGDSTSIGCLVPSDMGGQDVVTQASDLGSRLEQARVRDIMTANVVCVDSDLNLDEAITLLEQARLHAAPVVEDEGVLIGLVSRSDLLRGTHEDTDEDGGPRTHDTLGLLVEDVMTPDVVKVSEAASLDEAIVLFAKHRMHRMPVVSREDVVVGLVSLVDLVTWLARERAAAPRGPANNDR